MADWMQVGQARPANTDTATLFTPVRGFRYRVKVIVANVDGGANTFRIFHDNDGTTFDATTALAWDRSCGAGVIDEIPETGDIYMDDDSGALGIRSSAGSGLTFTAYAIRERI